MSKRAIAIIIAVIVAVGAIGFGRHWLSERWKWQPIAMPDKMARVPESWDVKTLARRLQKTHKLRDVPTFISAARTVGLQRVAAGGYVLPRVAGPMQLANIFKAPPAYYKLTFPEGFTASQMARRMQSAGVAAASDFMRLCYPADGATSQTEGSLFPDTYQVPVHATAQELISLFQSHYFAVVRTLPKTPVPGYRGVPLTQREITTLASLVERETSVPSERPLVAGVLLNRLRANTRLQCDATVQYVRQLAADKGLLDVGHRDRLLYSDLKLDSPYNTYRHKGLPPGPICNPGAASLRAAASPENTPYLFYVQSSRLGKHLFATTFAEHQHNIALVRAEK